MCSSVYGGRAHSLMSVWLKNNAYCSLHALYVTYSICNIAWAVYSVWGGGIWAHSL